MMEDRACALVIAHHCRPGPTRRRCPALVCRPCRAPVSRQAFVPDPRRARGQRHLVVFVLALAACAVLAGVTSPAAIAEWAADAPPGLLARLGGTVREPDSGDALRPRPPCGAYCSASTATRWTQRSAPGSRTAPTLPTPTGRTPALPHPGLPRGEELAAGPSPFAARRSAEARHGRRGNRVGAGRRADPVHERRAGSWDRCGVTMPTG
ncbi:transposase family protein [Streptomyces canus]|uniref:transposase family protein n=1 Tax=Streptomyces canus TaxID=58343 RepID=UPI0033B5D129